MQQYLQDTRDWQKQLIYSQQSIREALLKLNILKYKILCVIDNNQVLRGTLSDGDLRRALVKGASIDDEVGQYCNPNPIIIKSNTNSKQVYAALKNLFAIGAPEVDDSNKVIGFKILRDSDSKIQVQNVITVVMAGGRGSRLLPITKTVPKPILKIGNKMILEILLQKLAAEGFRNIFISVNHMADKIKSEILDGSHLNLKIEYIEETLPLGTAGSLGLIKNPKNLPILVVNSDLITNFSFNEFLNFHNKNRAEVSLGLINSTLESPYGVIEVNQNKVLTLTEKPIYNEKIFAGITLMDESIRNLIPSNKYLPMTQFLKDLIRKGKTIHAYESLEYWIDIGSINSLKQAELEVSPVIKFQ